MLHLPVILQIVYLFFIFSQIYIYLYLCIYLFIYFLAGWDLNRCV